jgi:hypothetical protein
VCVCVCVKLRASNHDLGKAGTAAGLMTARYEAGELTRVSGTGQAKHQLHVSLACLSPLGCTREREQICDEVQFAGFHAPSVFSRIPCTRVLFLSDKYRSSVPTATLSSVWAVGWSRSVHKLNKPTGRATD